MLRRAWLVALILVLNACTSAPPTATRPPVVPETRPDQDGTPLYREGMERIPDAVPQFEPITNAGNKSPYTVLGETYRVQPRPYGYRETGIASWYGTKFHGANTSNGEPYDVYAMSAAHKTLPIPCYVRVRNLDNGRSVVVRINDRGPFLRGRIIDLSYAAAYKLGYANRGTANVEIELLDPGADEWLAVRRTTESGSTESDSPVTAMWVQVGAFSTEAKALQIQSQLATMLSPVVFVSPMQSNGQTLYRVRVGPVHDPHQAFEAQQVIRRAGLGGGRIVTQ